MNSNVPKAAAETFRFGLRDTEIGRFLVTLGGVA
jgi:hypothetical protein